MASLTHLLSSRDRVFYDLFESAADTAVRAAELLEQMLAQFPEGREDLFRQITEYERQGDETIHQIRARLNQTFVTPIDREDIFALASAMDDVIDLTEEVADYLGIYSIEAPMEQAQRMAGILLEATRQVQLAVPQIRTLNDATDAIHEIHRLENDGDRISRDAIAALFHNGIDPMVVIRWKDIYERLEQGIDACEHVADVIDEIILKNK